MLKIQFLKPSNLLTRFFFFFLFLIPGNQDLEWGQNPEPSFRKNDTDSVKTNSYGENSYGNKEDATNNRDVGFNDNDDSEERDEYDLFAEYINNDDDNNDFDSEEDFNDISSTLTDVAVPKENEQASTSKKEDETKLKETDTSNTKTSVSKISDKKTSDSETSNIKASNPKILEAKFSTNKKNKSLEPKKNAEKLVDSTHSNLNDNHELEPDPCGSCSDIKKEGRSDDDKQPDFKKDKNNKKDENYSKDDETSGVVGCKENIYHLDSNDDDYENYDCQEPSIDEWDDVENEDFDCQEPDIDDIANEDYECQEPDFDDTDCVEDEDDCQEPNFDHRDCVDENDYNCFGLDIDDWGDAVDADGEYDVDYDEEDIFDYDNFEDYGDNYNEYDDYDGYEDYDDIFEIENDLAYESNLSGMIRATIKNCNENLKILQLSRYIFFYSQKIYKTICWLCYTL